MDIKRLQLYEKIVPNVTKVKLINGKNTGREALIVHKTCTRNGDYSGGKYCDYFQLTLKFEDGSKRATSCDYVEIVERMNNMDYKKMWEELKNCIDGILKNGNSCDRDKNYWFKFGLQACSDSMKIIESKYQPKQYTWSEILSMSPLPKAILSCKQRLCIYDEDNNSYILKYSKKPYPEVINISEMQGKWTIISE